MFSPIGHLKNFHVVCIMPEKRSDRFSFQKVVECCSLAFVYQNLGRANHGCLLSFFHERPTKFLRKTHPSPPGFFFWLVNWIPCDFLLVRIHNFLGRPSKIPLKNSNSFRSKKSCCLQLPVQHSISLKSQSQVTVRA